MTSVRAAEISKIEKVTKFEVHRIKIIEIRLETIQEQLNIKLE